MSHVGTLRFLTASTERMRIDSSGNLLVGTTDSTLYNNTSGSGLNLKPNGALYAALTTTDVWNLNLIGSDGTILQFRKDGTTVGSIGSRVGAGIYLDSGSGADGLLKSGGSEAFGWSTSYFYPRTDNARDLGISYLRFKDLYLSGTAYVGDRISHYGDSNTYVGFTTDSVNLVAGGVGANFTPNGFFINDGSLREDYDALSGTSVTCNVNTAGAFSLTMTGNTTFTFTAPSSGYSTGFVLQLTGNGGTVTWPASVDWAGGTAPDAPASGETDLLVFWTRDGGTTWYGALAIDAAA
jgi:hypothetical protein